MHFLPHSPGRTARLQHAKMELMFVFCHAALIMSIDS